MSALDLNQFMPMTDDIQCARGEATHGKSTVKVGQDRVLIIKRWRRRPSPASFLITLAAFSITISHHIALERAYNVRGGSWLIILTMRLDVAGNAFCSLLSWCCCCGWRLERVLGTSGYY